MRIHCLTEDTLCKPCIVQGTIHHLSSLEASHMNRLPVVCVCVCGGGGVVVVGLW